MLEKSERDRVRDFKEGYKNTDIKQNTYKKEQIEGQVEEQDEIEL